MLALTMMDFIAPSLTAYGLSEAGFNRKTRYATVALLVAANLSDVEVISRVWGNVTYLEYHRGPSDSLVGITLLAGLAAATVCVLKRDAVANKPLPPLRFGWLLLGCWAAAGSHLFLDFISPYGVQLFWPWSHRWYAADIEFGEDPVLLGLLIAGLGLPALLRLISEEVGARRPTMRAGAMVALGLVVMFWGFRWVNHQRALTALRSRTYRGEQAGAVAAFPSLANPFVWTGVVETPSAIEVVPINSLNGDLDTESEGVYYKPKPSAPLETALKTRTMRVFIAFARFPWARVRPSRWGWLVTARDLRFAMPDSRYARIVARVRLDKNLRVISQSLRLK
jgi:inner membrane protein